MAHLLRPRVEADAAVGDIFGRWWGDNPAYERRGYVRRAAFHAGIVLNAVPPPPRGNRPVVVDLGGGWGDVACALATLGYAAVLADDFADPGHRAAADPRWTMPAHYGVRTIAGDVVADALPFADGEVSAFISFDSLEHWHHSPKGLFARVMRQLRPGGLFLLGAPNCINLRKRLTMPFGHGRWTRLSEWYDEPVFRGHVREPEPADLRAIAADMGLERVRVFGRNWLGLLKPSPLYRALSAAADPLLRLVPSLCADIYVLGFKPGGGS